MIKQLKTLRQIKSECDCKEGNNGEINFYDMGECVGSIIKEMFPFFSKKHEASPVAWDDYQWKIKTNVSFPTVWYYKENWFELECELLEDELFEI